MDTCINDIVFVLEYIGICEYMCVYVDVYIYIYTCTYMYIHVVYMYICILHIYTYVHMNIYVFCYMKLSDVVSNMPHVVSNMLNVVSNIPNSGKHMHACHAQLRVRTVNRSSVRRSFANRQIPEG